MKFISVILISIACSLVSPSPLESRIYGGTAAYKGNFPHAVFLFLVKNNGMATSCGGSLIHTKWVLTAGHCLTDLNFIRYTLGSVQRTPYTGIVTNPNNFIIHDDIMTQAPNYHADIGLVKLETEAVISVYVKPIALPSKLTPVPDYLNEYLVAYGWGYQGDGPPGSDTLFYAYVRAVALNTCKLDLLSATTDHICVSTAEGRGPCKGDSGSGLQTLSNPPVLIGTFSMLRSCTKKLPVGYTKNYWYIDWINSKTGLSLGS